MPPVQLAPESPTQEDRGAPGYLRADLAVPAAGGREAFNFGLWVSLEAEELVKYLSGEEAPLRGWVAGAGAALRARVLPSACGGAPAVELVDVPSPHDLARLLQLG